MDIGRKQESSHLQAIETEAPLSLLYGIITNIIQFDTIKTGIS